MAELNEKYYTGIYTYSDGDIENDILDIVKNNKSIEMYTEYPVIYHLASSRQNILNWYPFNKDGICLEIGAGCGAITEALCQRLKKVISVDISKRRCEINFERNKDYDNLEIIAGNIHDIEFKEKFDYVILNGVFEYAISFTHSKKNPYIEFLSFIKSLIKADGCILIAIENRLGLKYFSGNTEDHTDKYFDGINEYEYNNSVRTFSKREIIDIIEEVGFMGYKFYYPYPDYKFPSEIFTDETITSFKYGREYYNFNPKTFSLFNESKVFKALAREEVIDRFANSFLIELNNSKAFSPIIYAKINNDRNENFRIATVIKNVEKGLEVEKIALNKLSERHIDNIYKNSIYSCTDKIKNAHLEKISEGIRYNFYNTKNMDDLVVDYIKDRDIKGIIKTIKNFFDLIDKNSVVVDYNNEQFSNIFGDEKCNEKLNSIRPANIDLICDNIMVMDNSYTIIDTEWIFDMFIPVEFIIWRNIRELYAKHSELSELCEFDKMLSEFGINKKMSFTFEKWALHFVNQYVGNGAKEKFAYYKKNLELDKVYYSTFNDAQAKLYVPDAHGDYSEENIIVKNLRVGDSGDFNISFEINDNSKLYRWDPCEYRCLKSKIEYINGEYEAVNSRKEDGFDIFENEDPQYIVKPYENRLIIRGKIFISSLEETARIFAQQRESLRSISSSKDSVINEKDSIINEKNNAINGLTNEIDTLKTRVDEKNNIINEKDGIINKKNDIINVLTDKIDTLEKRAYENNKSNEYLMSIIQRLDNEIRLKSQEYDEIINSKGWRLLDVLRRFLIRLKIR